MHCTIFSVPQHLIVYMYLIFSDILIYLASVNLKNNIFVSEQQFILFFFFESEYTRSYRTVLRLKIVGQEVRFTKALENKRPLSPKCLFIPIMWNLFTPGELYKISIWQWSVNRHWIFNFYREQRNVDVWTDQKQKPRHGKEHLKHTMGDIKQSQI